jgi:carbamoyl-phosphate synthase small subunit
MRALLALEDGSVFPGRAFGSNRPAGGEVIFNTSMTGYQEILTDPSYHGQIVVFTTPHLGNYGIHEGHGESSRLRVAGVVTREVSFSPSHPRSIQSLPAFLRGSNCFGIAEVDTRALTLLIRRKGALRGWLTTEVADASDAVLSARAVPRMEELDAVPAVTTSHPYAWTNGGDPAARGAGGPTGADRPGAPAELSSLVASRAGANHRLRVVVLDCGVKYNILRSLHRRGCEVTVFPAETGPEEIARLSPSGIVLSNGPGDPEALREWLPRMRGLIETYPTLAICLGHQLAALAFGGRVVKLPFGHHGGNHPVKDLRTRRIFITSQNHNYAIDPAGLPEGFAVTHTNLNDGTVEGLAHENLPLWSVQFHPEASPGPHEAEAVFDDFVAALAGTGPARPFDADWDD